MKGQDQAVVPSSENEVKTESETQAADRSQLEYRLREAQGGVDHVHPWLDGLLPSCRDAQLCHRDRCMVAQQVAHVYMEKLETSEDALPQPAQMRLRAMAGALRVLCPQGLLAHSLQLDNDPCRLERAVTCGRLSHVTGVLRETAPTLMNRRMPNGTYGGVRGKETKVGQKTFVSRPTRSHHSHTTLTQRRQVAKNSHAKAQSR